MKEPEPRFDRAFKTSFEIRNDYSENILITDCDFILLNNRIVICITTDMSFKTRLRLTLKKKKAKTRFWQQSWFIYADVTELSNKCVNKKRQSKGHTGKAIQTKSMCLVFSEPFSSEMDQKKAKWKKKPEPGFGRAFKTNFETQLWASFQNKNWNTRGFDRAFNILLCSVLFCVFLYCVVLYCDVLFCTVFHFSIFGCSYYIFLFFLFCNILVCIILYCNVLYRIVL